MYLTQLSASNIYAYPKLHILTLESGALESKSKYSEHRVLNYRILMYDISGMAIAYG